MSTNNKKYYSYKFPKSSDYRIKYFSPILILAIILIVIMMLTKYKELSPVALINVFLFCPAAYLATILFNMIYKTRILIIKIENVRKENMFLGDIDHEHEKHLLAVNVNIDNTMQRIRDKLIAAIIIVLILFFVLSRPLEIKNLHNFYITFILILILINVFLFSSLKYIADYFQNLMNAYYQIIFQDKYFVEQLLDKDIFIKPKTFYNKWRSLMIANVFFLLIIIMASLIFIDFRGVLRLTSLLISLIIMSIVMFDVHLVVQSNIEIMGKYDEHSKAKLGFEFRKKHDSDDPVYLFDSIKYLTESNKYLPKEMFNSIKETTKELFALFKKK